MTAGRPHAASTRTSRVIKAPAEALYRAFTDPAELMEWLPPGEMTGEIHAFDTRVGGGYEMSLYSPPDEQAFRGKTAEREDRTKPKSSRLVRPNAASRRAEGFR
jgi:uncharacterized protein YndB with AHSA1/START domain